METESKKAAGGVHVAGSDMLESSRGTGSPAKAAAAEAAAAAAAVVADALATLAAVALACNRFRLDSTKRTSATAKGQVDVGVTLPIINANAVKQVAVEGCRNVKQACRNQR